MEGDSKEAAGGKTDNDVDAEKDGKKTVEEKDEKDEDDKIIHKVLFPGVTRVFTTKQEAVDQLNFDCQSK